MKTFLTVVLVSATAYAAENIEWLSTDYDFGTMKEVAGPKTGSVRFVNRGDKPVSINQVRPSCGCTGADYTEGPIAPGDTATVSFTYNPKGRPGRFEKTVKVYVGEDNERTTVRIRGTVIGTPETLQSSYPVEAGPLRLSQRILTAGDVRHGTARHIFLQCYNQSQDTIYPAWNHPARSLSMGISSRAVAPGDGVTFSIYFNTRDGELPGTVNYPIEIISDSAAPDPVKTIVEFRANVVPDADGPGASALESAPAISASPATVDLGVVSGDKAEFRFTVSNTGKSELHIKRIQGERIAVSRFPVRLKPGKNGECKGSVRLTGMDEGPFAIKLEIVSDDPVRPLETIRIAGIKETQKSKQKKQRN